MVAKEGRRDIALHENLTLIQDINKAQANLAQGVFKILMENDEINRNIQIGDILENILADPNADLDNYLDDINLL